MIRPIWVGDQILEAYSKTIVIQVPTVDASCPLSGLARIHGPDEGAVGLLRLYKDR